MGIHLNVSTRSHPWIAAGMSLIPISFMSQRVIKGGRMVADPKNIALTQKTRPEMHREVRAITNFSQEIEFKGEQREDLMRKRKTRLLWASDLPTP
jgi:hypothetical protein